MQGLQVMRCLACSALAWTAAAHASTIQVTDRGCRRGVELVAHDAPLGAVLERLATTLGFRLEVEGELAGTVRMHATAPPRQLLADLLASQPGHVVWHARDPRCPGHPRITRVRLVAGAAAPPASAAPLPAVTRMAPPPLMEVASPQRLREAERESQRRKAEYDAHVRRHGVPPPGVEEDAARP